MSTDTQHVGIIGGGIVGICSAIALLESGHAVTVIERDAPGQGASFGNAGIISPWSVVPQAVPGIWKQIPGMLLRPSGPASVPLRHGLGYLPWFVRFLKESSPARAQANSDVMHLLCGDTVNLYRQLLAGTGHEDLVADAMYVHAYRNASKADLSTTAHQMRIEKGADLELIDMHDLRDLEPALSHDFKAAILIKGQARALDPGQISTVLADRIQEMGGHILCATVRHLEPVCSRWQVSTEVGNHTFDKIVLAAGAWSAELLKTLGISVPLATERGYHVAYSDSGATLNNSVMDTDRLAVGSSMTTGLRVAGTAEFAGLDTPPNPKRIAALQYVAENLVPQLKGLVPETWMGVRPSFPDSLPIIQEFSRHSGLIGAFGHSHYGLMMAPKTGRIVAGLVNGTHANTDLSSLRADRF